MELPCGSDSRPDDLNASVVAQEILGVSGDEIALRTEKLSGGASNNGLFLHTAETSTGKCFRFVEKHPKRDRELFFLEELYPLIRQGGKLKVPEIYAAGRRNGQVVLFMEYMDNVQKSSREVGRHPHEIGAAIAALSSIPLSEEVARNPLEHLNSNLLNRFHDFASERPELIATNDVESIRILIESRESLSERMSALPLCYAHGDIFYENIVFKDSTLHTVVEVALLDWGDYRVDRIGTDLFHFAGYEDRTKLMGSETFRRILAAYRDGIAPRFGSLDAELLAFAAAARRFSRKATNAINGNNDAAPAALASVKLLLSLASNSNQ
ncbi:MAG: aminoglycoside phosphotransferase family protein [Pararhodobacter sp.]|nr:aminoglycoside phosphotransferase family protein [Pararhodobacter sp.]